MDDENFLVRKLEEQNLADWAWRRGQYSAPTTSPTKGKLEGGIRLLFAQPKTTFRQNVPDGLITGQVLDALDLPDCTFASFQLPSGVCSLHTYPESSHVDDCKKLGLIFRTPQKSECSTGGLSISHDFSTGITTALVLGYSFSIDELVVAPKPVFEAFLQQIRENWTLWNHALLLPSLFLVLHTLRVRSYIYDTLSSRVIYLESCIGITKAGRSGQIRYDAPEEAKNEDQEKLFIEDEKGDQHMQRDRAKKLTATINDLSTSILFARRSPQWDMECADFLLKLLDDNQRLQTYQSVSAQHFRQTLDYVKSYSAALSEATETSQARLQLQLNIVCSETTFCPS